MPARPDDHTQPPREVSPGAEAARMPSATAPAVTPPRWSGRKTAVAAALAVGLGVGAAAGATTAFALGDVGQGRPPENGRGPGGGQGTVPGGGGGSTDPNGIRPTT